MAAWRALRNVILDMAVLVVLCVGTGYVFSVATTFFVDGRQFYEAVSVLLVFILLGHGLEMPARAGANDAIRALLDLTLPIARVLRDGKEVEIPTAEGVAGVKWRSTRRPTALRTKCLRSPREWRRTRSTQSRKRFSTQRRAGASSGGGIHER